MKSLLLDAFLVVVGDQHNVRTHSIFLILSIESLHYLLFVHLHD